MALYSVVFLTASRMFVNIYFQQNTLGGNEYSAELFRGWTVWTVVLIILQAWGGLGIAVCMKYTSAILKTMATSFSIVLTSILGAMMQGDELNVVKGCGIFCAILATCDYAFDAEPDPNTKEEKSEKSGDSSLHILEQQKKGTDK